MYLSERLANSNQEQVAFMVTLCHDEWLEEEQQGLTEGDFESWLTFIGDCAVKMSIPRQRLET